MDNDGNDTEDNEEGDSNDDNDSDGVAILVIITWNGGNGRC